MGSLTSRSEQGWTGVNGTLYFRLGKLSSWFGLGSDDACCLKMPDSVFSYHFTSKNTHGISRPACSQRNESIIPLK